MFSFPLQLTTSRIGNLARLIQTLLNVISIHRLWNIQVYLQKRVCSLDHYCCNTLQSLSVYCMSYDGGRQHRAIFPCFLLVIAFSRLGINHLWLSILLCSWSADGEMNYSLSSFAPEKLVSRDRFGHMEPSACSVSGIRLQYSTLHYSIISTPRLNLVRTGELHLSTCGFGSRARMRLALQYTRTVWRELLLLAFTPELLYCSATTRLRNRRLSRKSD